MNFIEVLSTEQLQNCINIRTEVFVVEQKVSPELEIDSHDTIGDDCRHFFDFRQRLPSWSIKDD